MGRRHEVIDWINFRDVCPQTIGVRGFHMALKGLRLQKVLLGSVSVSSRVSRVAA